MNYFDENNDNNFSDQPEEIQGQYDSQGNWQQTDIAPPVQVQVQKPANAMPTPIQKPAPAPQEVEEVEDTEENEDVSSILTDARLRLEMGKLYEMIMKHDLFEGAEADPRAMKNVQKEIRDYAQERMEIMLGMRQETPKEAVTMENFPFNSLEVEVLKALAATATKGASRDAEPMELSGPQPPPARTTLNPIGKNSHKTTPAKKTATKPLQSRPANPMKRVTPDVERILQEEGVTLEQINEVFDPNKEVLTREQMGKMTEEELKQRNAAISARNRRAEAAQTTPMPTVDQQIASYNQRSAMADATVKGWQELIEMVKVMPSVRK